MYCLIETYRLKIRPLSLADKDFIFSLTNSNGWLEFIGNRNILSVTDAENYIQKILHTENYYYNVFELKDTKQALGIVTLLKRENQEFPDFGFAALPEFEGKGFTFEASVAYMKHLIQSSHHKKLLGLTKPYNQKSISLLTKLGFRFQGKQITESGDALSIYEKTVTR